MVNAYRRANTAAIILAIEERVSDVAVTKIRLNIPINATPSVLSTWKCKLGMSMGVDIAEVLYP